MAIEVSTYSNIELRQILPEDCSWIAERSQELFCGDFIVSHGKVYYPAKLEGFIASIEGQRIVLATYYLHNQDNLELITIDAPVQGKGIGSKLLLAVEEKAKTLNCKQVIVVTTNDNIDALAFYQKRGYLISTISYDAIAEARKIKPTIPLIGNHGININCQIELTKTINVDRQKNSEFFCGP